MNLRRLFSSKVSSDPNPTLAPNGQNPERDSLKPEIDFFAEAIHESNVQELGYGKLPLLEEYKIALKVAEQYGEIYGIEEKMAFWDAHPKVFGIASVVVFDKHEEKYWGHHGQSRYNVMGDLAGEENYKVGVSRAGLASDNLNPGEEIIEVRYKVVWICPSDVDEFWPFVEWCEQKCRVMGNYTIMDKDYYWKQIKNNLFPKQYLSERLKYAEDFHNSVRGLSSIPPNVCSEALAKKYFFFYGNRDASNGFTQVFGFLGSIHSLFTVFYNTHTCPLSIYGEIFFQYFNGCRAAQMFAFFQGEGERMDRGEDIRLPADNNTEQAQQSGINESQITKATTPPITDEQNQPSRPIFIKIAKRDLVKRQLSFGLDEDNKERLINLIDLDPPTDKIHTKMGAKVLADYFRQIYHAGDIDNTTYSKEDIANCLAYWFVKAGGGSYSSESFRDFLQLKDTNPKAKDLNGKIRYHRA